MSERGHLPVWCGAVEKNRGVTPDNNLDASPVMAPARAAALIGLVMAAIVPALVLRFSGVHPNAAVAAVIFGLAIISAAFLLAWGAEAAQVDISAGLAIAVLAFIAVLPEYAVDMVFASKGGHAFAQHGRACLPPGARALQGAGRLREDADARAEVVKVWGLAALVVVACSSGTVNPVPKPIEITYGPASMTMLTPYPSDRYTVADASTPTGLRVHITGMTGDAFAPTFPDRKSVV